MQLTANSARLGKVFLLCAVLLADLQAQIKQDTPPDVNSPSSVSVRPADIENKEWWIFNYFVGNSQAWPYHTRGRRSQPYLRFELGRLQGSPGCGRFDGNYRRLGDQLTISANWMDTEACSDEEKKTAAQILSALLNVRRIEPEPAYWHLDSLLLADQKRSTLVTLAPRRPGTDLSELKDTFWHFIQLEGSRADLSGIIIVIRDQNTGVTFSAPSYFISFPFEYKLQGIEFHPAWTYSKVTEENAESRRIAVVFENVLHRIRSYEVGQDILTFFDKDRHEIMALHSLRQEGIENRRWNIAKYRDDGKRQTDEEGLVDAKVDAEITFLHGRIEGSAGCGALVGDYRLSGDHITLHADFILAGLCYQEGEVQNGLAISALRNSIRIEQKDDRIFLRDKDGKAQILLVPH